MAAGTRRMVFEVAIDDSKTGKSLQNIDKNVGNTAKSFGTAGKQIKYAIGTVAAGAVVAFGRQMAEHAATMEAIERRTDTVFGSSTQTIRQWADDSNEAFGLSENGVLNLASGFGDLLVPMGFTREETAKLTTETLDAANALSEWTGGQVTTEEAASAVSKAMLGEREELKKLGISIMEADVQQRLLEKGQKELTGTALQQAKAIATQELIFLKSKDALDAYTDRTGTAIEEQKNLKATTAELKDELAQQLVPVLSGAVGFMADAAEGVKVLVEWFDSLPDGVKQAALAMGGLAAALAAVYAHPVVAGLALVAGAVAAIGGNAREYQQDIDSFKTALEDAGGAADDAAMAFLLGRDDADELRLMLAAAGLTLEDMTAHAYDGRDGFDEFADKLKKATKEGKLTYEQQGKLVGVMGNLVTIAQDAKEEFDLLTEQENDNAAMSGALLVNVQDLTGEYANLADVAYEATGSLADLANEQRKAIDPAFALWDATDKYAEALQTKADLERDGKQHTDEYDQALRDLVEAQADLNWRTAEYDESSGDSIAALYELGRQAGLTESEIRDMIAAITDLNNTHVMVGATTDLGALYSGGGGGGETQKFAGGGVVRGPIGAPVKAIVHAGETVRTPAQEAALSTGGGVTVQVSGVFVGDEQQLGEYLSDVLETYGRNGGQ